MKWKDSPHLLQVYGCKKNGDDALIKGKNLVNVMHSLVRLQSRLKQNGQIPLKLIPVATIKLKVSPQKLHL